MHSIAHHATPGVIVCIRHALRLAVRSHPDALHAIRLLPTFLAGIRQQPPDPENERDEPPAGGAIQQSTDVVVVDDHRFMRELISRKLDGHGGQFKVVAEGGDAQSAVEACEKHKPHLIVLDVNLPDESGIHAVSKIKEKCPHTRVLLCTAYVSDQHVIDALRSGADGFVEKTNSWAEFVEAVERVSRGERYFSTRTGSDPAADSRAAHRKAGLAKLASLSEREQQVLKMIAEGKSSKEVANALGISVGTVDVHRANVMKKLDLKNIAALVTFSFRLGLIH